MIRTLWAICSTLSAAVTVSVLLLWVRSYHWHDAVFFLQAIDSEGGQHTRWAIYSYAGSLRITSMRCVRADTGRTGAFVPIAQKWMWTSRDANAYFGGQPPPSRWRDYWFYVEQSRSPTRPWPQVASGVYIQSTSVETPYWAWMLLAAIPPALWARSAVRRYRMRYRARSGRCPECGYDLRHLTERCPECGREIDVNRAKIGVES